MRLSKKQQAIIGIIREQEILEKRVLFEALEGVLEEKKKYRSRYDSFVQTIKKLVEKGVLEWREEHLVLASRHKQKTINRTLQVWRVLKQLRQQQQPLTLANLKTKMDIREWIGVLAEWKLTLPGSDQNRLIDLDAILDNNPREIEALLRRMQVDIEKITASGLIFSVNHHHQLQQGVHRCFCKKIQQFSLPHQKLEALIEAKLPHQASGKTIRELLEPITQLSCQEQQQIANSFENPFLRKTAAKRLCSMIQSQRPFKSKLQTAFPWFFRRSLGMGPFVSTTKTENLGSRKILWNVSKSGRVETLFETTRSSSISKSATVSTIRRASRLNLYLLPNARVAGNKQYR